MKLQYLSDLHLEFADNRYYLEDHPLEAAGDVLVMAGDIMTFGQIGQRAGFFDWLSDTYEMVYWIPGNHEYYQQDIRDRSGSFTEAIRPNVILLNNTSVIHKGVRLIFSTLWSRIRLSNAWRVERGLNDFYQITYHGQMFESSHYNELFRSSADFLADELDTPFEGKTVVVTHHVPTFLHYPPAYLGSYLNEAFATNLDPLIEAYGPDYWIFGHHHSNVPEFMIGNTKMLTNQLGYVQSNEHLAFDGARIIEL